MDSNTNLINNNSISFILKNDKDDFIFRIEKNFFIGRAYLINIIFEKEKDQNQIYYIIIEINNNVTIEDKLRGKPEFKLIPNEFLESIREWDESYSMKRKID